MDIKKYIYVDEDGARAIYDISHNRLKKMDEYLYVGDLIISYSRTNKVSIEASTDGHKYIQQLQEMMQQGAVSIEASTDEHVYSVLDILEYNQSAMTILVITVDLSCSSVYHYDATHIFGYEINTIIKSLIGAYYTQAILDDGNYE
jgi:hypothetical protein